MAKKERPDSLKAIDLFSGAGGLSAGLAAAGFKIVAAVEADADAAASYRANHPETLVVEADIRKVAARGLREELGLAQGELELLAGCPPCQGFTRLTERHGGEDPRNALIREYLRFVKAFRPRACMLENVPGLVVRGSGLFKEFLDGLQRLGYVWEHSVLELADYGVPQFRKRLVLVAGLDREVKIPLATHADPREAKRLGLRPWTTVRDAIGHLEAPPIRPRVRSLGRATHGWHIARNISPLVRKRLEYSARVGGRAAFPSTLELSCHKRTPDGYFDVYGVMQWNRPSPTMTSGCTNASKGRFGHPTGTRPLTPREAALLQTFPRGYKFRGAGMESVSAQIGNALPSRFARIMARAVRRALAE